MTFSITPKKVGIAAALEAAEKAKREAGTLATVTKPVEEKPKSKEQVNREAKGFVEPEIATERIRIIYDDSGSMYGKKEKDAVKGSQEYLRYCGKNKVAVAIHPMNKEALTLDTNLPELAALIEHIGAGGGSTPLYETLAKAQKSTPIATRYIVFSDGIADDSVYSEKCIATAIEAKTPVDTVFITDEYGNKTAERDMKTLAERTGGIFLVFDSNKVNFGTAFKYLSPGLRHMLADKSFVEDLQAGKVK